MHPNFGIPIGVKLEPMTVSWQTPDARTTFRNLNRGSRSWRVDCSSYPRADHVPQVEPLFQSRHPDHRRQTQTPEPDMGRQIMDANFQTPHPGARAFPAPPDVDPRTEGICDRTLNHRHQMQTQIMDSSRGPRTWREPAELYPGSESRSEEWDTESRPLCSDDRRHQR